MMEMETLPLERDKYSTTAIHRRNEDTGPCVGCGQLCDLHMQRDPEDPLSLLHPVSEEAPE